MRGRKNIITDGLIKERFWARLPTRMPAEECWEWAGTISKVGYGILVIRPNYFSYAHRLSYVIHKGTLPDLPGIMVQ